MRLLGNGEDQGVPNFVAVIRYAKSRIRRSGTYCVRLLSL